MRAALAVVACALTALAAGQSAEGVDGASTQSTGICKVRTVGGATVHVYCGPARATVKLGGKSLTFKGGRCGPASGSGISGWGLGIGSYTVPPAKPKLRYFGVAYVGGTPKAGTYKKGEFVITFHVPGKSYSVIGSPLGVPAMKVTVTKAAKKGSFAGIASGKKVTGTWTC